MTATLTRGRVGLAGGPLLFAVMLLLAPPEGMSLLAWRTAAVGALMATWWITEAIPIPATALLPIVLFPLLGIATVAATTAPYANPVIYLFLGGFLIAMALESCGLHKRMALGVLGVVGTKPANLILGFMVATAFISMWVSNTATVVMMLPMATSVMALARDGDHAAGDTRISAFGVALLLGIAYSASIGGLGTLIGTPPNALLAGFMSETYGVRIGFVEWMFLGVPIVLLALPVAWLLLTKWLHPVGSDPVAGGAAMLREERHALGVMTRAEWTVGTITALTAAAWVTRPIIERWVPAITDTGIAITGALLMFIVPLSWRSPRVALTWKQAERLPWSVLILFGGGLSLAAAIQQTGLAGWIGGELGALAGWPLLLVILVVTAVVIFLTELTSNTATAAAFLPVVASLAVGIGADPLMLAIPTALAASCAFMLPVATPPNAIVYGTGALTVPQMARAGVWLNIFFIVLLPLVVYVLAGRIFT
ncbi:MAG: DASS family sodium-coupled anion symporter [Gemmatimonadaceae bacterium]